MANNLLKSSGLWKLQQGDCTQVTFYIHNLTFIWLTDVLVLQVICTGSSNGTEEVPGDRSPETLKEVDTGQLAIADAKPKVGKLTIDLDWRKSFYLPNIGDLPGTDAILQGCQVTPNCDDFWSAGG